MSVLIYPDLSYGQELQTVQGSDADFVIQIANTDGTFPVYASADTVTSSIYTGQDQTSLFSPTTVWTGGTGYLTGSVTVSPTAAQTAALEANGEYILQVKWTQNSPVRSAVVARRRIRIFTEPGSATQLITTYNTYHDMVNIAEWITGVQDMDSDQEGFYSQRLKARQWMDWVIINSFQNNWIGMFGRHSEMAFAFGSGYGQRQSIGPNPTMMGYLASDLLLVTQSSLAAAGYQWKTQIIECCAYYAIGLVGKAQLGLNDSFYRYGVAAMRQASRDVKSITAEIDTNGDGLGDQFVNLGTAYTLQG